MPQLRKVVLAVGNTLAYADTYEQALRDLAAVQRGMPAAAAPSPASATPSPPPRPETAGDQRIQEIRGRLEKYRVLTSQGRWSEAGKELEAVEALVRR